MKRSGCSQSPARRRAAIYEGIERENMERTIAQRAPFPFSEGSSSVVAIEDRRSATEIARAAAAALKAVS